MFRRLHIYTVHSRPGARLENEPPVFVREGFNFWTFFLALPWTLYNRLWLAATGIIAFSMAVTVLDKGGFLSEGGVAALLLGMQLISGFHGNDWLRLKLKKRGFITTGLVSGDSVGRAELRYFEQYAST